MPFGAGVYDDKNTNIGSVGQAGQAYARVDKEEGTLTVQWGAAAQEQCHIRYSVLQQLAAGNGDTKNFIHLESLCL
ncbi:FimD/PapC C-terminal domain-containing protein [Apirhabdus apintestini]|nr:FimD/PapC C-terminal domain-containing protein [Enterobacteriaceae bacterium CA-0114]